MQKDLIRQKLINYLEAYRKNAGVFNGLVIIHDFIEYIKSEPYAFSIIKPYLKYVEEQTAIAEKNIGQFENIGFTMDQELLAKMPMYKNEVKQAQKAMAEKKEFELKPELAFPVSLNNLLLIHKLIANLPKAKKEKIGLVSELPDINLNFKIIPNQNFILPFNAYLANAMGIVAKKIVNKIDSEHFLTKGKASQSISFDAKASMLKIKGSEVKISRKSDPSTDHFILQAIFDRKDIGEEIDFKDIALDYIKMNEYDGVKNWQKFRHACDRLNEKVDKSTNGEIKDFIKYHSGKTGWCKINQKYL